MKSTSEGIRNSGNIALAAFALLVAFLIAGCKPSSPQHSLSSGFFSSVEIIGSRGNISGQFNKPRSVAVDTNDNLYVVDMTGRVQKFAPDGTFLLSWQMPQTDKGKPKGMCLDSQGRIIVLEPHYSRVNHFAPDGHLLEQWGRHGTNAGELAFPRAVAVNAAGDIFVSEYGLTERVQQFSASGKQLLRVMGKAGSADAQFNRPEGLGLDRLGRLYVADSCNHRIQVFADGKFLCAYGRPGLAAGELSYPYDIRIDHAGNQFVCEFGNSRLQVFDPQHQPIETIGGPGSAPGEFSNPWSIAFDSHGNLYVADSLNHRVQKFIRRKDLARASAP